MSLILDETLKQITMFLIKSLLKITAVTISLIALPFELIATAIGKVATTLAELSIKL